ncbi:hypothetical protein [Pseudarthrobacter sulfonivorans]|uniref:hypothetical protein n=1 Tax=Pseudarthrobacter sulfonivorans TaxID=121292 RepID=UPI0021072679|nr:hypothetical protein [Pseudarthrobacter sulfonivorans]
MLLHGVVAPVAEQGTTAALFALVSTGTSFAEKRGRITVPGLEPEQGYRVEVIFPDSAPSLASRRSPRAGFPARAGLP